MKNGILLNSPISSVISEMGHTDMLTISDCGLPIHGDAKRIDLALKRGVPGFLETLDTVLCELGVERVILAKEITTVSPELYREILKRFENHVKIDFVSHEDFKKLTECS